MKLHDLYQDALHSIGVNAWSVCSYVVLPTFLCIALEVVQ